MKVTKATNARKDTTRPVKDLLAVLDLAARPGFEEWLLQEKWKLSTGESDPDYPFQALIDKGIPQSHTPPKSNRRPRKPKSAIRPAKVFVETGGEPGGYLRWLVVLEYITQRWAQQESRAWKGPALAGSSNSLTLVDVARRLFGAEPKNAAVDTLAKSNAKRSWDSWKDKNNNAFSPTPLTNSWKGDDYRTSDDLYNTLDETLCELFSEDGRPTDNLQKVMSLRTRLPGDTLAVAIERLRNWVSGIGCAAADHLSRLHAETFVEQGSPQRTQLLTQVVDQLMTVGANSDQSDIHINEGITGISTRVATTSGAHGLEPITNVYIDDGWTGLRAFATAVCLSVKEQSSLLPPSQRPVLVYLPLDRYQAETNAAPARNATEPALSEHIDSIIGEIYRAAFPDQFDALNHDPSTRLSRILRLQEELPKRKLIIILGGVEVTADPFGAIWNVLRHSDWLTFIKQLIQGRFVTGSSTPVNYQTRFLVLSNRPVDELKPWTSLALSLPKPYAGDEARALLLNPDRTALESRLRRHWSQAQLGPTVANQSLHAVYSPGEVGVDALMANGMPSESELCIFRVSQDSGNGDAPTSPSWRLKSIAAWVKRPPNVTDGESNTYAEFRGLVTQWLAVSVSGLRLDTLVRLNTHLRSETPAERLEAMAMGDLARLNEMLASVDWIEEFAERYRYMVVLTTDRDRLNVTTAHSDFELHGRLTQRDDSGSANFYLDVRNERVREFLLAEMLQSSVGGERFRRMNELLARESLSQATTRMRHTAPAGLDEIVTRRLVQTIFHGLLSLNAEELTELDPRPEAQPLSHDWRTLPENGYRRLVYLYEFLYRKLLEAPPAWRLGRTLAKEDLRLSLLAMFANPGWSKRVLSIIAFTPPDKRSFEAFGAFAFNPVPGFGRALQPSALHLRGELGVDLFISLLRACLTSTKHPLFAQRAEVIGGQLAIQRSVRPGSGNEFRRMRTFKKLQIDALQATNTLEDSSPILIAEMKAMRVDLSWVSDEWIEGLLKDGWLGQSELTTAVKTRIEEICKRDHRELGHISDLVFRYGEHIATRADWNDDRGNARDSLRRYAQAYVVFFIADRVRSAAATLDDSTVQWPSISARAMRYFVRVALKLAKLTAKIIAETESSERPTNADAALQFYQHAVSRIDVYCRHLAGYPTEEVHGLILMASAARVRSSIARSLSSMNPSEAEQVERLLGLSLNYLEAAWPKLVALGLPKALFRRFTLERFKTYAKLSTRDGRPSAHVVGMVARERDSLKALAAGSKYWDKLLEKLSPTAVPT